MPLPLVIITFSLSNEKCLYIAFEGFFPVRQCNNVIFYYFEVFLYVQYINLNKTTTISLPLAGHYLYIETSAPRKSGEIARVISPRYPATNGACLQYW